MAALTPNTLPRLGLLLALSITAAAGAQEPASPEPSRDEQARELYQRSERAYEEGDYEQAIVALKRAYELSPRRGLLYNLANALERLGRYEDAISYLEQYAADAPEPQRTILVKRMASLEVRAEEQRRETRVTPVAPVRPDMSLPSPDSPALDGPDQSLPEAQRDAAASRLVYLIGGAGIASIGVGVVFGLSAHNARSEGERLCIDDGRSTLCPTRARSHFVQAGRRALAADIAWGAGAAALGAALYLVLRADSSDTPASALRVTPTSRGVGLDWLHAF